MLTQLDVINAQLATMGEAPIEEAEVPFHPWATKGILDLRLESRLFQTRGWWFNTLAFDAIPSEGITLPCGILRVDGPGTESLVIRGTTLYDYRDKSTLTRTVKKVKAVVEVDFADLPPVPQTVVYHRAVLAFQAHYDSTPSTREVVAAQIREATLECNAEHVRNLRYNRLLNPSTLVKIMSIRQGAGRSTGLPT